jgi:pimeloyl-ACP methyl ester carboxylesterase
MILMYLYLAKVIDAQVKRRYDGAPTLPYFTPEELDLEEEPFSFYSGEYLLRGSRYSAKNRRDYIGLMIVFHGLGAGRTAYFTEIDRFAKLGYLVYAFDYTGCMQSEGPYIKGLGQSVKDTEAFFRFLDGDPKAKGLERYAFGHSWGGYTCMMACTPEHHIKKAIAVSGFVRTSLEYVSLPGYTKAKPFRPLIKLRLYNELGKYGDASVFKVLDHSPTHFMISQGKDDDMVPFYSSGALIEKRYKGDKRFTFKFYESGYKHQPCLTKEAAAYQKELMDKGVMRPEANSDVKMDIGKATELNEAFFKSAIDFLRA